MTSFLFFFLQEKAPPPPPPSDMQLSGGMPPPMPPPMPLGHGIPPNGGSNLLIFFPDFVLLLKLNLSLIKGILV